jgi:hypothetical protein
MIKLFLSFWPQPKSLLDNNQSVQPIIQLVYERHFVLAASRVDKLLFAPYSRVFSGRMEGAYVQNVVVKFG